MDLRCTNYRGVPGSIVLGIVVLGVCFGTLVLPGMVGWADAAQTRHVVLVSVDGLRPDAVSASRTPNIYRMQQDGVSAVFARVSPPPHTLPSHASMLTGLNLLQHQVYWNDYRDGFIAAKTVFQVVKEHHGTTAALVAKSKLRYLLPPGQLDYSYVPDPVYFFEPELAVDALTIARVFSQHWATGADTFTFIHLAEPDTAGHRDSWMSPQYMQSVAIVDQAIGIIRDAIDRSGRADTSLVLLTADHGGYGTGHASLRKEVTNIPWILVGPGVPRGLPLRVPLNQSDTSPTLLKFLGLAFDQPVPGQMIDVMLSGEDG